METKIVFRSIQDWVFRNGHLIQEIEALLKEDRPIDVEIAITITLQPIGTTRIPSLVFMDYGCSIPPHHPCG